MELVDISGQSPDVVSSLTALLDTELGGPNAAAAADAAQMAENLACVGTPSLSLSSFLSLSLFLPLAPLCLFPSSPPSTHSLLTCPPSSSPLPPLCRYYKKYYHETCTPTQLVTQLTDKFKGVDVDFAVQRVTEWSGLNPYNATGTGKGCGV